MIDGVYRVTHRTICAGMVVRQGRVHACAPVLWKRIGWWLTIAVYIGPEVVV